MEIILCKRFVHPEGDILVADWELAVGLELCDLTWLELTNESGISGPKLSNIIDVVQFHRPALKTQSKSPSYFLTNVSLASLHNFIMDDATAKNLEPLIIVINLKFK